jgi:uncharacterized protein YlxW (UPF0749 family)
MTITLEELGTWVGILVGFTTLLTIVIKFIAKTFRTERLEAASMRAELGGFVRLQEEIAELKKSSLDLNNQIDELERKLNRIREIESDTAADLAILSILITQFPCPKCDHIVEAYDQIKDVVDRMAIRRTARVNIINATN